MIPVIIQHDDGRISEVTSNLLMLETFDKDGNIAYVFQNSPTMARICYSTNATPFILDNQLILIINYAYDTEIKNLTTGYALRLDGIHNFSLQNYEELNYLISSNCGVFYCPSLLDKALYIFEWLHVSSNFSLKKLDNKYFLFSTNSKGEIEYHFDFLRKKYFEWEEPYRDTTININNVSIEYIYGKMHFVDKEKFVIFNENGKLV